MSKERIPPGTLASMEGGRKTCYNEAVKLITQSLSLSLFLSLTHSLTRSQAKYGTGFQVTRSQFSVRQNQNPGLVLLVVKLRGEKREREKEREKDCVLCPDCLLLLQADRSALVIEKTGCSSPGDQASAGYFRLSHAQADSRSLRVQQE